MHTLVSLMLERKDAYDMELLDLRNDFVFRAFFGDWRNRRLLLHFLNSILDDTLTSVELTDPHLEPLHRIDKTSAMDIRVRTEECEQINIEMQVQGHEAFNERMLVYWAKMYANQEEVSRPYVDLKKAVQIVIANFNFLPKQHYHSKFQLMEPEDGTIFSSHAEIHVLELRKLKDIQVEDALALEQ